ncbi:MAG: hypothetical protein ACKV2T_20685 [Kofleriaceae bacterium]
MRRVLAVLVIAACDGDDGPEFPLPADLPIVDEPPDPFMTFDGRAITTADEWMSIRRPELARMFAFYQYGFAPPAPANTSATMIASATIENGTIDYREYEVRFGPDDAPPLFLAVFTPANATNVPIFVGPNACGNQTITIAPEVRLSPEWIESSCDPVRGSQATRFPIAALAARGVGFATFHQSDIDPDDGRDKNHEDGIHPHFVVDEPDDVQWGTLAAWAFGVSRAVDVLVTLPALDATRIATIGHSRRGKVALLAAAYDTRIAMAFPHQSGTGGATLTRADLGEPVSSINLVYPHWFDTVYKGFSDDERRLPIDQHLLLGMVAPRPVLVTNGELDDWADPPGALRSVDLSKPIYTLLGASPDDVSWQVRPGGHSLETGDWTLFLDFADEHW